MGHRSSFYNGFAMWPDRWVLGPTEESTCIDQYRAQIGLKLVDFLTGVALVVLPAIMV